MSEGRPAAKVDYINQPAYGLAEAARYLKVPVATVRAWTLGRHYPTSQGDIRFRPLIKPARKQPPVLSFSNMVEAHVLRALRTEHGISIKALREAVHFAEKALQIDRLLLSPELRTDAGRVFLCRYGALINLSASGQLAMRQVFDAHLKRVTWKGDFPIRLHPFVASDALDGTMPIAIDPTISFGRPIVLSRGISTAAIASRIDAGESVADIAADYDLTVEDVERAVVYERAA